MTAVERELRRQRKELLALERRVDARLVGEYANLYRYIKQRLDELVKLIQSVPDDQRKVSWLVTQMQYVQLLDDIARETTRFAFRSTDIVTQGQRELVGSVPDDAIALIEAIKKPAIPAQVAAISTSFRTLHPSAFAHLVGNASNGKPLSRLIYKIAPRAKQDAERILTRGIATGTNPNVIGRQLAKATNASLTRAQTIARTETLRSYREATRLAYKESPVVSGWYWHAQLDTRTCFACAMMSGTVHTNAEQLDGHVRCRCTMIPKTLSWDELGIDAPDTSYKPRSGEDWFDNLTEAEQKQILGQGKYDALKSGEVSKQDLISRPRSKEWGTQRRNASLREAKAKAAA